MTDWTLLNAARDAVVVLDDEGVGAIDGDERDDRSHLVAFANLVRRQDGAAATAALTPMNAALFVTSPPMRGLASPPPCLRTAMVECTSRPCMMAVRGA